MAEDTILIYANRLVSRFKQVEIVANIECHTPPENEYSIWGAEYMLPMIKAAHSWSPEVWPKPAPFRSDLVSGYMVGRRV